MDTDRTRSRTAEPAEEEIKKHGDQLKAQVEEAAGKKVRNETRDEAEDEAPEPDGKDDARGS